MQFPNDRIHFYLKGTNLSLHFLGYSSKTIEIHIGDSQEGYNYKLSKEEVKKTRDFLSSWLQEYSEE